MEVNKMDNKFTAFLEAYSDDIRAFIEALKSFIESIIAKLTAAPEEGTEE